MSFFEGNLVRAAYGCIAESNGVACRDANDESAHLEYLDALNRGEIDSKNVIEEQAQSIPARHAKHVEIRDENTRGRPRLTMVNMTFMIIRDEVEYIKDRRMGSERALALTSKKHTSTADGRRLNRPHAERGFVIPKNREGARSDETRKSQPKQISDGAREQSECQ